MRDVYIVDGSRTPFIKAKGIPNKMMASDLAVSCGKSLLARQSFEATDLDEVVIGCVAPSADEANIGRIIALRLGCGQNVMGWTVQRNCASGMQAIDCGFKDIATGRHDLVLAGGTEAMSRAPLIFRDEAVNWFAKLGSSKSVVQKLKTIVKFKPKYFSPVIALLRGLTDPIVSMNMGQTAEKIAFEYGITRREMDKFAVQSHLRAVKAIEEQFLAEEVIPAFDWNGDFFEHDNGVRQDSSVEKLGKLRPAFDKPFGTVTAGNSSQVTDGAALLILASEKAIEKHNLQPIAKISDVQWSALDPTVMGFGPAHAIAHLLHKNNLGLNDIDFWEINEAFAAQVIGCLRALDDEKYCREKLELPSKLGCIDVNTLNVDGGAIALGHPVGASGARITLHLCNILRRHNASRGVASLCIGGGQGGAILLENIQQGV